MKYWHVFLLSSIFSSTTETLKLNDGKGGIVRATRVNVFTLGCEILIPPFIDITEYVMFVIPENGSSPFTLKSNSSGIN